MQAGEPATLNPGGTPRKDETAATGPIRSAAPGKAVAVAAQGADGLPAVLSAGPNPMALLAALRRRWFLVGSLGFLAASGVAAVLWSVTPLTFTAQTLLHVAATQPIIFQRMPEPEADFANYQRSQVALVKSRTVLTAALREPKVRGLAVVQRKVDPIAWMAKEVKADFTLAPVIMRVTLTGEDPDQLGPLLDAVREAYLSEIVNKEHKLRVGRLERLKQLYAEKDGLLREKRQALRVLADDLGSGDSRALILKQEFAMRELNAIQTELMQVQSQLRQTRLEALGEPEETRPAAEAHVPEAVIEAALKADPIVQQYAKQVAKLEKDIAQMRLNFTDPEKETAYQRTTATLATANKALTTRREELRPEILKEERQKVRGDPKTNRVTAQKRVAFMERLKEALAKDLKDRSDKNDQVKKKTVDLEWLKTEIAQVNDMANKVLSQVQALEVEIQAPVRIKMLEETTVEPNGDKRVRMAGLGFCGVFGMIAFGIAWLEFRARKVNSGDEVASGLRIRLLGSLPVLSERARQGLLSPGQPRDRDWQLRFTECVDTTRLALVHTARAESLRVIMVTSAFGGEGKTMLSTHLAISMARSGFRTLLVDCDLRRPSVHKIFNQPGDAGVSEVLRGEVAVRDVVRPGPVAGLALLTAGDARGQAGDLLRQDALAALFATLKEQYDYIVVDSAPVLPVADSQAIGQLVDGVILSVLRNVSRLPSIHAARERLTMLKIRVLGAVVHGDAGSGNYPPYH